MSQHPDSSTDSGFDPGLKSPYHTEEPEMIDGLKLIRSETELNPNEEAVAIASNAYKVNRFVHPLRMLIAGNYLFVRCQSVYKQNKQIN